MNLDPARISRRTGFNFFYFFLVFGIFASFVHAQEPAEIAKLAQRAVESVARNNPKTILVSTLQGCLLEPQVCEQLDKALHSSLESALATTRIIGRQDVTSYLTMNHLLSIDGYDANVLQILGRQAGADLLVTEDLKWTETGNEMTFQVFDTAKPKQFSDLKIATQFNDPISSDEPLILKDPENGVSLVVSKNLKSRSKYFPSCKRCPTPPYTEESRKSGLQGNIVILATITEEGIAQNIVVVKPLSEILTLQSVKAVQGWKFKPGIGPDGKPFAVRVPIEVTYRLLH